ncbi:MAG: DUF6249 domain-containing protein [Limnohabitans sp.]|jgi:hypothetical protein|nr:DUF6249 domain-containing protein [Burkholderiales bacterium]
MDFGTTLKHLAPFAIPILALCIPIVALIMHYHEKIQHNQHLHETIRLLAEKGVPIPPELLQAAIATAPVAPPKTWSSASQLRGGIINVSMGIGILILYVAIRPEEDWLWIIGAIPILIGLVFFLVWFIETRKKSD